MQIKIKCGTSISQASGHAFERIVEAWRINDRSERGGRESISCFHGTQHLSQKVLGTQRAQTHAFAPRERGSFVHAATLKRKGMAANKHLAEKGEVWYIHLYGRNGYDA